MYQVFYKRIFDLIISLILIILLSPLFILIPICIIISEQTFSVLYISERVGYNQNVFKFFKFRTMKIGCECKEPFAKPKNDDRVTKFGKFLRCTSLDELPQLFNVLKGDMSLVGNRPLPVKEASKLIMNCQIKRFKSPAGITGWWQVNKANATTVKDRIRMDEEYVDNISFERDLHIILLTPLSMFRNF